jgi:hypothetical protein
VQGRGQGAVAIGGGAIVKSIEDRLKDELAEVRRQLVYHEAQRERLLEQERQLCKLLKAAGVDTAPASHRDVATLERLGFERTTMSKLTLLARRAGLPIRNSLDAMIEQLEQKGVIKDHEFVSRGATGKSRHLWILLPE